MPVQVLLVEDDPDTCEVIRFFLESAGHSARVAVNGLEALGSVRHAPPDLVLVDVVIPALNGYEVCRLIKEDVRARRVRSLPVALITARKVREPRREAFILDWTGADAVLYKPFPRHALLTAVDALAARAARVGPAAPEGR